MRFQRKKRIETPNGRRQIRRWERGDHPRVARYHRVSDDEQRERQTIVAQREHTEAHLIYMQWEEDPDLLYEDDGVTGTFPVEKRPQGARMMVDARAGKFDVLLVARIDRLGRKLTSILACVDELTELGIQVIFLAEMWDISTAQGRFALQIMAAVAELDRNQIVERCTNGRRLSAEKGRAIARPPFGYTKDQEGRLVPNHKPLSGEGLSEVEIVQTLYRMLAVEKSSASACAAWLNQMKVPTTSSGTKKKTPGPSIWHGATVRFLIHNPIYKGEPVMGRYSTWWDPQQFSRPNLALVDAVVWDLAIEQMRENRTQRNRHMKDPYLLERIIRCKACGKRCSGITYSKEYKGNPDYYRYRRYRCHGYMKPPEKAAGKENPCAAPWIDADAVEEAVWQHLLQSLAKPEQVLEQILASRAALKAEEETDRCRREELAARLKEQSARARRAEQLFVDGEISRSRYEEMRRTIEADRRTLQTEIARLDLKLGAATLKEEQVEAILARLRKAREQALTEMTFEQRQRFLRAFVKEVRVWAIGPARAREHEVEIVTRFDAPLSEKVEGKRNRSGSTGYIARTGRAITSARDATGTTA